MRRRHYVPSLMLVLALAGASATAHADGTPQAPAASEETKAQARTNYVEGVKLVQRAQWSEALAAFEASAKLFPNAATTLNMGACERALGRYVRARSTLSRALAESAAAGNVLPESSVVEAKGFIAEIDHILARVTLTVDPPEATITIDGRPLARTEEPAAARPIVAAGVLPPGPGTPPPAPTFDVVLDPGAHVITLARKGFTDVVVNRTVAPGSATTLELKLDRLPATLKISSTQTGAIVKVDQSDVGPTPVDVLRPAGAYHVTVNKLGFLPYDAQVTVQPGEEVKLSAALLEDKPSIAKKWWFWTTIAAVIGGGVAVTYVATRPKPPPPPYDGGSANWVVKPAGFRF
jgi:hypothetical protein